MGRSFVRAWLGKYGWKWGVFVGVYVLFLIQTVRDLVVWFTPKALDYSGWGGPSDLYVNYQAGFIRRGLLGEVMYFFARYFSANVEWMITIVCLICFAFLCFFFIKSFCKKGYALYLLPLCFFLGFSYYYHRNRDYLIITMFILNLWIYGRRWSMLAKFLLINGLTIFAILTHELFGMILFPTLFLLLCGDSIRAGKNIVRSVVSSMLFLLPGILTMLLVTHFHGDQGMAQSIWDSWRVILTQEPMQEKVPEQSSIGAIGLSPESVLGHSARSNFLTINNGVPSWLGLLVTFAAVYYVLVNYLSYFRKDGKNYTGEHKTVLSVILLFQFICWLLPSAIGFFTDFGRLFFYWTATSFALFLLIPLNKIQRLTPVFLTKFVNRMNNGLSAILPPSKIALVILMMFIGISPVGFSMGAILHTSVIYNVYAPLRDSFLFLQSIF
jgi:hypothetical protein